MPRSPEGKSIDSGRNAQDGTTSRSGVSEPLSRYARPVKGPSPQKSGLPNFWM